MTLTQQAHDAQCRLAGQVAATTYLRTRPRKPRGWLLFWLTLGCFLAWGWQAP